MSSLSTYVHQILTDTDGSYSSKRFVTLLSVGLMAAGFIANLFWDYTVEQYMYEAVMYVVIAGLGFTGAEKFAPKKVAGE